MARTKPITTQVLETLQRNPGCEFDLLVKDCSEFTWNQLFYEVDRLSRLGQLCLTAVGGSHHIRLPFTEETMKPKQPLTQSKETDSLVAGRSDSEPKWGESVDRHTWIAQRAYHLYEEEGRRDGHALKHWLQAEREIRVH